MPLIQLLPTNAAMITLGDRLNILETPKVRREQDEKIAAGLYRALTEEEEEEEEEQESEQLFWLKRTD